MKYANNVIFPVLFEISVTFVWKVASKYQPSNVNPSFVASSSVIVSKIV